MTVNIADINSTYLAVYSWTSSVLFDFAMNAGHWWYPVTPCDMEPSLFLCMSSSAFPPSPMFSSICSLLVPCLDDPEESTLSTAWRYCYWTFLACNRFSSFSGTWYLLLALFYHIQPCCKVPCRSLFPFSGHGQTLVTYLINVTVCV